MKFYICSHCGNIIAYVKDQGVPVMCCGQKMEELVPNTTDAAVEKHVPVISVEGNQVTVKVSSVEHPWRMCTTSSGSRWRPGRAISASPCIPARSLRQCLH